jgi:hypothetical protein
LWSDFNNNGKEVEEEEENEGYDNTFDEIFREVSSSLSGNPDYSLCHLPDIAGTNELFQDSYRGSHILENVLEVIREEASNWSQTDEEESEFDESFNPYFNPHGYPKIPFLASENCEDVHGNFNPLNSTIGRYEYVSCSNFATTIQEQQQVYEVLEETSGIPIPPPRYSFNGQEYDLFPSPTFEDVNLSFPPRRRSRLSSYNNTMSTNSSSALADEEFSKTADIIYNSPTNSLSTQFEDNDEYDDLEDSDEEESHPIIEINSSRYRTYRGVSTNTHRLPLNSRRRRNYLCVFCKGNNEPAEIYQSHPIRVNGIVMCPFLRNHVCAICKVRRGYGNH